MSQSTPFIWTDSGNSTGTFCGFLMEPLSRFVACGCFCPHLEFTTNGLAMLDIKNQLKHTVLLKQKKIMGFLSAP